MAKFIFITGGVLSSLGKGITAASIGALLEGRGYSVLIKKLDPYINVDPGTMNPFQHGEVYVTEDGAETDLDLGHYERFLSTETKKDCNITTGQIYHEVINKERRGVYLGNTVQVIPHITDEIKKVILKHSDKFNFIITEIGGTVGDIESLPFLETIRQLRFDVGVENILYIHVTLVPFIKSAGEMKTKPTQHSVRELRAIGIQPDLLVCRSEYPLDSEIRRKIALFCNVSIESVINAVDVSTIYQLPIYLYKEGIDSLILEKLGMDNKEISLEKWDEIVDRIKHPKDEVNIAIVGKYIDLKDAYLSLNEALSHGGIANNLKINVKWINAEDLEKKFDNTTFEEIDGILIPGGFGERGIAGKINAANYARIKDVPFFGICLGMQCAVIEYARNVLKFTDYPVIDYMVEQKKIKNYGGSMRLGSYLCQLNEDSNAHRAYGVKEIYERHRHRLEFNNVYKDKFIQAGMNIAGINPDKNLVEIVEIKSHRWFLGCQFHPEFKSKPFKPHPLFVDFVKASYSFRIDKLKEVKSNVL